MSCWIREIASGMLNQRPTKFSVSLRPRSFLLTCVFILSVLSIELRSVSGSVIHSPPLIVKQPPTVEILFQLRVDENPKPFIIVCEAEGYPEPRYKWTKNGKDFDYQTYDERISQQPGRGTLVVTEPRNEDIGQYQCLAINEHGTAASNTVFVRKAELNSFNDEEIVTTVTAEEGKSFSLRCASPDGWPPPSVYWVMQSKEGAIKSINSSRITVDPEGTLWFSNVTREDKSTDFNYTCTAHSPFRNEYKLGNRVFLNVTPTSSTDQNKYPPTLQYMSKGVTIAQRGKNIELWCIIGGTSLPEIKWTKKGGQLPYDRLEFDNYGRTLRILNVDFSDESSYDCDATNGVGSPISYSISLQVNAPPYFTVEPELANAADGETVEFRCEAHGKPVPEIKWIHNGKPIEQSPPNPRRILETNKITLRNVLSSDTGNYGCNASNSFGYVYKEVYINVLALAPEIYEPPHDTVTTESKNVILTCRVIGAPKPLVSWTHNEQELTGGRFKVFNGDLEIQNAGLLDAGSYACFAKNKFGNDSRSGYLDVKVATRIDLNPRDFNVTAGNPAIFRCSATAGTNLTFIIEWLHDGEIIDLDAEPRHAILEDNSLKIYNTKELDTGVYTCVARTEYDEATASATLLVQNVPNRPELLNVDCGKEFARLSWEPTGDNRSPILQYTIQYNTSFAPALWEIAWKDVPATQTNYTVSMSPWVNYTFRVIARNKIGSSLPSSHSSVCKTPENVPFKNPDKVKGDGGDPNSLRISWTPMPEIEHNAPNFHYRILWKPDDEHSEWSIEEINDWRSGELTFTNMPTYRPYLIQVWAVNEQGDSNVTPTVVRGFSGQDYPNEAPTNFTILMKIDGKAAFVGWNSVRSESLNGKFEGYKIQTWVAGEEGENAREMTVPRNVTRALVDNLIPGSRNLIRVCAYNTAYNGPFSRVIKMVTDEGAPGAVGDLNAYKLGASSIYLRWDTPEQPNGLLLGYRIFYEKVVGTEVQKHTQRERRILNPGKLEAVLARLEPDTKYRIHVYAVTKIGMGAKFVEESTYDSNVTILSKPQFDWDHLESENAYSAVKVRVIRLPESDRKACPGPNFYVQYKREGELAYTNSDDVEYDDSVIVRGLDRGQMYVFRVVSVDGTQELASDEQEIYTLINGQAKESGGTTSWFFGWIWIILALSVIAILVLIIIIASIVKRYQNSAQEREIPLGRLDPDKRGIREYAESAESDSTGIDRTSVVSDSAT